jgi:hypothetical protein
MCRRVGKMERTGLWAIGTRIEAERQELSGRRYLGRQPLQSGRVEVETALDLHPPHRTGRADFPHPAHPTTSQVDYQDVVRHVIGLRPRLLVMKSYHETPAGGRQGR